MKLRPFYRAMLSLTLLAGGTIALCQAADSTVTTAPSHKHRHRKVVRKAAVTTPQVVTASTTGRTVARTTTRAGLIHTDSATTTQVAYARRRGRRARVAFSPWTEPTFADSTVGDIVDGEDPVIRKAAIDGLGPYNGTVVIADPTSGRILSIVNQKLALKGAYQPCSTVKTVVSLAALSEHVITPEKNVRISRRFGMDMTQALAHSNNLYFAKLGEQLGFDRVEKYAKLFGLGEKAGLDIPGEEAGYLTPEPPSTGVGMMTSFGDGIRLTPLELTSILTAISNGGTMYYLQYPRSEEDVQKFIPRVKRMLDGADFIPEIKPGMLGAVEYGTARRVTLDSNESIYGKTGTCTDTAQPGVHLGWFGSFNDAGKNKLVVVVLLTGGRGISGPIASGIAGNVYHNLAQQHYFGPDIPAMPTALISMPAVAQ